MRFTRENTSRSHLNPAIGTETYVKKYAGGDAAYVEGFNFMKCFDDAGLTGIQISRKFYDNAGSQYEQTYFEQKSGGFVLIHKRHNRGESFDSELFVAIDESETVEGKRPDAEVDGEIWDFKRLTEKLTNLEGAVQRGFTEARKQGAEAVAYAAIETAEVVIMNDSPTKIAEAIQIAHKTHRIVWQNIIFALAVKAVFLGLGALGLATMWEAVFADVGVALAAIANATRVLK